MSLVEYSHEKHIISVAKGSFLNYYLWRNIKVGTLCFSAKSWLATPRFNVCKSKNNVNLPQSILARDVLGCFDLRCKQKCCIPGIGCVYSIFFANSYITFVRACMCVCFIIIYVLLYFFTRGWGGVLDHGYNTIDSDINSQLPWLGNSSRFLPSSDCFHNQLFRKFFFQEYNQSVKQFVSRSGPTFSWAWFGSKLFSKVIRKGH